MTAAQGLRYQSAPERRARILEIVRTMSHRSAAELSDELGVSEMTIRRDIALLAAQGSARAVRGGISRLPNDAMGTDFGVRARQQTSAKRRIAAAAAALVRPDTSIALDAGTTALELARALPMTMRLTVVTPSLPAMLELAGRPELELVGLGGILHPESQAFAGPPTLSALRSLRVQQAFLAASAIRDGEVLCGNLWDSETKRTFLEVAEQVVLLADASKFERSAMTRVGPLSAVDVLIVDDAIRPDDRARVEDAGVTVIVAGGDGVPADEDPAS